MKQILVTGASGWLGRHLVPLLQERGFKPFGLDIAPSAWTDAVGSVADRKTIDALFGDHAFDGVIHAGALHKPDIARFPQQSFVDVNITGTLNLLEAASAKPGTAFVFTSTTSLMISQVIRNELSDRAAWLDEGSGPLEPRNIYGVTKLAAEGLCRQHHLERQLPVIVLRTARFFPEDDDTHTDLAGPNLKANELMYRRATVEDMARAHIAAIEEAPRIGFGLFLVSAPTPFTREDVTALKSDARSVILRRFPEAEALYAERGWQLPASIGRVYDGSLIERELGFVYQTRFASVLDALRAGTALPAAHDAGYAPPHLCT
jgi:nucleoside-diphosphate-sugar epimerase